MRFKTTVVYRIRGLIHSGEDRELVNDQRTRIRTLLTTVPDPYCAEGDRHVAIANLMLDGALAQQSEGALRERLATQLREIRDSRRQRFGSGAFFVIEITGEIELPAPTVELEFDDFVVWMDGGPKKEIRAALKTASVNLLSALGLAVDSVGGAEKVHDSVVYLRPDGKPLYAYTFEASGGGYASFGVADEVLDSVQPWYESLSAFSSLERVSRLIVSSLETQEDPLRSFLAAWAALEVFVNKVFPDYERLLFDELNDGSFPPIRKQYLDRIREVMKKYNPADKFMVVSLQLSPESADQDFKEFKRAKRQRDLIAHGQEVTESSLPVKSSRDLARKYLRLHLIPNPQDQLSYLGRRSFREIANSLRSNSAISL